MFRFSSRLTLQELIDALVRLLVEGGAESLEKPGKTTTISPFDYNAFPDDSSITYLQGIKGGDRPGTFLLVGANDSPGPNPQGFAYVGPLDLGVCCR